MDRQTTLAPDAKDRVEWQIVKFARDGTYVRHSEGAQTLFSVKRARQVVKVLGNGWHIRHMSDANIAAPEDLPDGKPPHIR